MAGEEVQPGGIKGFFIGVVTSDAVQKMFQSLLANAVAEGNQAVQADISLMTEKIKELERNAIDNLDAMDGKMGNMQEQMSAMPGQMINGVIDGVVKGIADAPGEIFGGLFGKH